MPYGRTGDFLRLPYSGGGQRQNMPYDPNTDNIIQMLLSGAVRPDSGDSSGNSLIDMIAGYAGGGRGGGGTPNDDLTALLGGKPTSSSGTPLPNFLKHTINGTTHLAPGGNPPIPNMPDLTPQQPTQHGPGALAQQDQQLMAAIMQANQPLDTDAMIQDAIGGINKAYGAEIGTVRHQNAGARADTKKGTKEIRRMYKLLARDMTKAGKREARQGQNLAEDLQGLGTAGANQIQQSANNILSQNAAAASALEAPELATTLNKTAEDQAQHLTGNLVGEATRQATNQRGMSGVQQRYFDRASGSSLWEGTNRASDLLADLQDYLQANRDKIAEIAGQKAQAVASAKNDILAQASDEEATRQQNFIDNLMKLQAQSFDIKDARHDNKVQDFLAQQQAQQNSGQDSLFDKDYAANLGLLRQAGPVVSNMYTHILQTPEFQHGSYEEPHGTIPLDNNFAGMLKFVQSQPGYQNLSPAELTALMQVLMRTPINSQLPST